MKICEMTNLFVGYNEEEDFKILICAMDSTEAHELARQYGFDSNLKGSWKILDLDVGDRFDCDYVIA